MMYTETSIMVHVETPTANSVVFTKRDFHIDFIEFFAIAFVLLYHSTLDYYNILEDDNSLHNFRYYLRSILSTCVPLFFFANGFLLLNKKFDLRKHIYKTIKITSLYFVWSALTIFIKMYICGQFLGIKETISSIIFLKLGWNNHLWFLKVLVVIYIIFPIIKYIYDSNRALFIYFIVICSISTFGCNILSNIASVMVYIIGSHRVFDGYDFTFAFSPMKEWHWWAFVYFCVGGICYQYKNKIVAISAHKRNLLALFAIIVNSFLLYLIGVMYSHLNDKMYDIVWDGYDTIFTFINVISIYILCLNLNRGVKWIQIISINTLGIYLIHGFFIFSMRPILKAIGFSGSFLHTFLFAFFALAASLATTTLIRKIRFIKWLVS